MARRYPGSLVARVLVNRYYALRKKYSKPKSKPGRLDFVKHWLLHWEGLLIGGVFVGGLGMTAAKLYVNERMDDIARRGERCRMYTGSCMMAAANLSSIQDSLGLYETLFEYAAPRSQLQQEWQQSHQQRMQAAAQQVECWQSRAAHWLPASAAPTGAYVQPGSQHQQQQETRKQQAKELLNQQQGNSCQAINGIHGEVVPSGQQAVSAEQAQQQLQSALQQQQQQGELIASHTLPHKGVTQEADQTQDKQPQPKQQLQPQSQQPLLPPSDDKVVSQADAESSAQLLHTRQLQQQPPEQKQEHVHQQQHQQQQQQQSSWNPVLWFCTLRLRQAQRWLAEEQRAAASADRGARLWQQLAQHAQQQVVKLREQEQQQLLVLMAHTAQLERWKDLDTNTRQFDLWFDLPSTAWLTSWWYHHTAAAASDASASTVATADAQHAAAAAAPSAAGTRDSPSTQEAPSTHSAGSSHLEGLWRAARGLAGPHGDQDTAADKAQPTSSDEASAAATKADAACRSMASSHYLRIRLLLPAWIPESMEERDFDLLCKDYIDDEGTAGAAATDTQAADGGGMPTGAPHGREGQSDAADAACSSGLLGSGSSGAATTPSDVGGSGAAAGADVAVDEDEEVEIDAGGALVEVFEEALDVIQGLLEAAHDA